MLNHASIMSLETEDAFSWSERDVILYGLGLGFGENPLDQGELRYVYEKDLRTFPTFAVILGFHGGPVARIGLDQRYVLHGEHAVTFHKSIPTAGTVLAQGSMIGAWDKGPGKGAIFVQKKVMRLDGEADPLATVITTVFGRAEGGFGGPREGQPRPHQVPDRLPEQQVEFQTAGNQALIYRLSGDENPLHADPEFAQAAGFPAPILHGLCTYGITARAVIHAYCGGDDTLLRHHQVRFSAPVYPGDRITVDLWRDGDIVSFEARVPARDVTVIRNGKAVLGQG